MFEIKDQKIRREFYKEVMGMSVKENVKFELTDFEEVALEMASEKIRKEEKFEMARKMNAKGEPIEKIIEYTGLSREEIEKL